MPLTVPVYWKLLVKCQMADWVAVTASLSVRPATPAVSATTLRSVCG